MDTKLDTLVVETHRGGRHQGANTALVEAPHAHLFNPAPPPPKTSVVSPLTTLVIVCVGDGQNIAQQMPIRPPSPTPHPSPTSVLPSPSDLTVMVVVAPQMLHG